MMTKTVSELIRWVRSRAAAVLAPRVRRLVPAGGSLRDRVPPPRDGLVWFGWPEGRDLDVGGFSPMLGGPF